MTRVWWKSGLGVVLVTSACSGDATSPVSSTEQSAGDPHSAINVSYSNATSHLSSTDVQSAIDELTARPSVGPQGPAGPQGHKGRPVSAT